VTAESGSLTVRRDAPFCGSLVSLCRPSQLKIFVAQFLNTGVIITLVNARLPSGSALPFEGVGIFEGEVRIRLPPNKPKSSECTCVTQVTYLTYIRQFEEFDARWYAVVGVAIVLTMVVNTMLPHVQPLIEFFVAGPLSRSIASKLAPTQHDLNHALYGPKFRIATRYPVILNTVFVVMTFSPGLPILYIFGMMTLWASHWVDKVTLFRMYERPPRYDASLAFLSAAVLPWALLAHLVRSTLPVPPSNSDRELTQCLCQNVRYLHCGCTETMYVYQRWWSKQSRPHCDCTCSGGTEERIVH
jgi:hypothetical protein